MTERDTNRRAAWAWCGVITVIVAVHAVIMGVTLRAASADAGLPDPEAPAAPPTTGGAP